MAFLVQKLHLLLINQIFLRLIINFMKNFQLLVLLCFSLTSCVKEDKLDSEFAFFGGEIINPNTNYVVLSRGECIIDTLKLDKNNRFLYKIENLNPGIYYFRHQPENQIVLLESGDSLHIRLNTIDFDESLVFTGKGAKKNNYLINLFLENESERQKMLEYCQLSPDKFNTIIETSKNNKHEKLKIFERKHSTSQLFNEIADANVHYEYYANKEIYPFAYYGNNELKNLKSLPESFYNYRGNIDYNNNNLQAYYPYYRFLNAHFNNLALSKHFEHSKDSVFLRHSLDYNLDRIYIIDSLVTNEDIKNTHLKHTARRFIYTNKSVEDIKKLTAIYMSKSTNENHKEEINKIAESFIKLAKGKKVPNISLLNHSGKEVTLQSIIKRPSVIYFWVHNRKSQFKDSHLKAQKLKEAYPDLDFIAINASRMTSSNWKSTLQQYGFSLENEYRFKNPHSARNQLFISSLTKAMLIDGDGTIVDPHDNMSDVHFEEHLVGLLNQ